MPAEDAYFLKYSKTAGLNSWLKITSNANKKWSQVGSFTVLVLLSLYPLKRAYLWSCNCFTSDEAIKYQNLLIQQLEITSINHHVILKARILVLRDSKFVGYEDQKMYPHFRTHNAFSSVMLHTTLFHYNWTKLRGGLIVISSPSLSDVFTLRKTQMYRLLRQQVSMSC